MGPRELSATIGSSRHTLSSTENSLRGAKSSDFEFSERYERAGAVNREIAGCHDPAAEFSGEFF